MMFTRTGKRLHGPNKAAGVVVAFVEIVEGNVLIAEAVAGLLVKIMEGVHQYFEVVLLVYRHDFVALFVGGRMKAEGQVHFCVVVGKLFIIFAMPAVLTVMRFGDMPSPSGEVIFSMLSITGR